MMKILNKFFAARREDNLTTAFARQRVAKSMPGEAAALAALRLSGTSLV